MKIQILVDGEVVSTLTIAGKPFGPGVRDAKKQALNQALNRHEVSISQSLRASFRVLDDEGRLTGE